MNITDYLEMIKRKQAVATKDEMYMAPAQLQMIRDLLEYIIALEEKVNDLQMRNISTFSTFQ